MEFQNLDIRQIHQGLIQKRFSALELAKFFLERIDKCDKEILSFLTVVPDSALFQAQKTDNFITQSVKISLLAGMPCAIKDNILVKDIRCTAASKILANFIAPYDATVIKKLKAEGTVILGKTNLDEFAMGSSCENSAFARTRNPRDFDRVPGGSSGGSAAAVAAGLCSFALGSDTGGSVRLPASFCGVVGLKPTYGAVSRSGLIAMASSLDQIGSITKNVADARIVFDVISGKDPLDSTSVDLDIKGTSKHARKESKAKNSELRVGIPKEYFVKGMDEGVEKVIRGVIEKFRKAGAQIKEISLPHTEYALAVYYIIMPCEVSANMARYDGIKYGYSKVKSPRFKIKNLLDVYLQSRAEGLGDEVRRRIMLGTYALSAGYYEAYYLRAQKVRTKIVKDFQKAFKEVDIIFSPVSPTPAFKLGEKTEDPLTMYLSDIFTVSVNLAGLPAISVPAGETRGLPVGLQIIGRPYSEETLFRVGEIFEQLR